MDSSSRPVAQKVGVYGGMLYVRNDEAGRQMRADGAGRTEPVLVPTAVSARCDYAGMVGASSLEWVHHFAQ
jgi:hypothetical protein